MKTNELIRLLAEDGTTPVPRLSSTVAFVFLGGAGLIAVIFAIAVDMRPDFSTAIWTIRVMFKHGIVAVLAAVSFVLLLQLGRPTARLAPWLWLVGAIAVALAAGVTLELAALSPDRWMSSLNGTKRTLCLVAIPSLSVIPLAAALAGLRYGAPRNAGWAGAGAGLAAGAIGATLYALVCDNDSPLFVAAWYTIAIGLVVLAGAAAGRVSLRW